MREDIDMGLYDSFIAKIRCPICKKVGEFEFQTKDLVCLLLCFRKGDKVETDTLIIKDGIVKDAIGRCPHCQELLTGDIVIKNHRFKTIKNIKKWVSPKEEV